MSIKCVMALMIDKEVTTVDFQSPLRGEKYLKPAEVYWVTWPVAMRSVLTMHTGSNHSIWLLSMDVKIRSLEPLLLLQIQIPALQLPTQTHSDTFKSMHLHKHCDTCLGTTVCRQTKFKRHFVVFLLSHTQYIRIYKSMQLCISHTLLLV